MPAINAVVAILDFGGREHRFPGSTGALADDVEVAGTVGLDAELDAVARMEDGLGRDFDLVVARAPQDGVLETESGPGGGSGGSGQRNGLHDGGPVEGDAAHHDVRRSHPARWLLIA